MSSRVDFWSLPNGQFCVPLVNAVGNGSKSIGIIVRAIGGDFVRCPGHPFDCPLPVTHLGLQILKEKRQSRKGITEIQT